MTEQQKTITTEVKIVTTIDTETGEFLSHEIVFDATPPEIDALTQKFGGPEYIYALIGLSGKAAYDTAVAASEGAGTMEHDEDGDYVRVVQL